MFGYRCDRCAAVSEDGVGHLYVTVHVRGEDARKLHYRRDLAFCSRACMRAFMAADKES